MNNYPLRKSPISQIVNGAVLFLALSVVSAQGKDLSLSQFERLLEDGDRLYAAGRYEDAINSYQEAKKLIFNSEILHYKLGNTYFVLGRKRQAIREYTLSIKINPSFQDAYLRLANAYCNIGGYDKALIAIKRAKKIDPSNPMVFLIEGIIWFHLGDRSQELRTYEEAYKLSPDDVSIANNLAWAYAESDHKLEEAERMIRKAIGSGNTSSNLYGTYAYVLQKMSRYGDALGACEEALKLDPKDENVIYRKSVLLHKVKDRDGALRALRDAISSNNKLKRKAATDEDFNDLREDSMFKMLVK